MGYTYTLSGRGASVDTREVEDFKKKPLRKLKKILGSECSYGFQKSMGYSLRKAGKFPQMKKEAPKKEFQKIEMSLEEALKLINKIFILNKKRDEEYSKKTKYIKTLIAGISQNNLPVYFWKNGGVVYFQYAVTVGNKYLFTIPKNK